MLAKHHSLNSKLNLQAAGDSLCIYSLVMITLGIFDLKPVDKEYQRLELSMVKNVKRR